MNLQKDKIKKGKKKEKTENSGNFVGFYRKIATAILKVKKKKFLKLRRKHGTFRDFVGADIAVTVAAMIATASPIWGKVLDPRHGADSCN
jgi:hypothetical protein